MRVVSNRSGFKRTLVASALMAVLAGAPAVANDNFSGSIKGHIEAGANAVVELKHKGKGITRTITADSDGNYVIRKLPVGNYTITIRKPGYQDIVEQNFVVKLGGQTLNRALAGAEMETIAVSGSQVTYVDLGSSTGSMVVTSEDLDVLPVNTDVNSVALLAPSASKTSGSNFGGAPNIGGSSSAENGYYLNGINITNIRTGLGVVDIPFAAIAQTEVQMGGVSSEFGNALGGIINSVSKSGGNEFEFGVKIRHDNESLRSRHDDLLYRDGSIYDNINQDDKDFTRFSVEASGPIIEDSVFFYAMYAPQKEKYWRSGVSAASKGEETSDRYMAKIDWYINENHSLEFTHINFENEDRWDTYEYDQDTRERGAATGGSGQATDGGTISGIKYTALIGDNISLEAVAGRVVEKDQSDADNAIPGVYSNWANNNGAGGGDRSTISSHSNSVVTDSRFTRDQFRVDLMWDLDEHQLKFGIDYYDTHVDYSSIQNGTGVGGNGSIGWWSLRVTNDGNAERVGLPAGSKYVEQRIRRDFSDSHVLSTSVYAQDSWQATDDLVLNLGVRVSNFANELSTGESYAEVKNQIAPRLQAIYDLTGDGSSKVFATWGRYFQPISANMNITQGGSRHDELWFYAPGEMDSTGEAILLADGSPSRGEQTGYHLQQDSALVSPTSVAHNDLKAMYSDEITFGYETEVMDGDMVATARVIHRELKRSIEDADLGQVMNNWYEAQGLPGGGEWMLFNPGDGLNVIGDFNGDGTEDHIQISAEDMGMPKAERQYAALELSLKGAPTERLYLDATYTWSHLWGNTAGLVNQNDDQADPGWTVSYDYAGLQDHASGNLPSDRRHKFKVHGKYDLTDNFAIGFATTFSTGTPISYMGLHPEGVDSCAPGSPWADCPSRTNRGHGTSFYDEAGNPRPRGTAGTTPFFANVDLSLIYTTELAGNELQLKGTVYNLLNNDTVIAVNQTGTMSDGEDIVHNPEWGNATMLQTSRWVSLTANYRF